MGDHAVVILTITYTSLNTIILFLMQPLPPYQTVLHFEYHLTF